MGVVALTEPVTVLAEIRFEKRRQHLSHGLLDQAIQHRWHPEGTLAPIGFGNEHPAHRRGAVGSLHYRGADSRPLLPPKGGEVPDGHPVNARCPLVGSDTFPCLLKVVRGENSLHQVFCSGVPILPSVAALISAPPTGGIGSDVLHTVGSPLFGSALRGIECSGFEFMRTYRGPRFSARYYGFC